MLSRVATLRVGTPIWLFGELLIVLFAALGTFSTAVISETCIQSSTTGPDRGV